MKTIGTEVLGGSLYCPPNAPPPAACMGPVEIFIPHGGRQSLRKLYLKVRQSQRIVSQACVVAIGVRETGEREVIGFALRAARASLFAGVPAPVAARGLHDVLLLTSDSREGLRAAIAKVLTGATWQRCRLHFMSNLLAHIPSGEKTLVAALVRTIFVQLNRQVAGQRVAETLRLMRDRWPHAADALAEAEDDVLAEAHGIFHHIMRRNMLRACGQMTNS